jgi:hypothetical protein
LLPSGQCFRTLSYWQLVDQPLRLIFDFHSVNPRCDGPLRDVEPSPKETTFCVQLRPASSR